MAKKKYYKKPATYSAGQQSEVFTDKSAIIYTRVSSDKQMKHGNGLDAQKIACEERASRNQVKIVGYFSDGWVSGWFTSREGIDDAIAFLAKHNSPYTKVHYIIVDDMDRIVRDVQWWRDLKAKIEKVWWAKIHALKQKLEDTPEWVLFQSITASVKQYERENGARRTVDRQRWRLLNGFRSFTSIAWYRYEFANPTTKSWGRVLVPDWRNFDIIKSGLEKLANGMLTTKAELAWYLKNSGFTNSQWGKSFNSVVERILTFPWLSLYNGKIFYEKWKVENIPAKHQQMINDDTFNKLLKRTSRRPIYLKNTRSDIQEELFLRWVMKCESCQKLLTGSPSTWHTWNIYNYYTCRNPECTLKHKSYNTKTVHNELTNKLQSMWLSDEALVLLEEIFRTIYSEYETAHTNYMNSLNNELEKVTKDINNTIELIINTDNKTVKDSCAEKLESLTKRKEELLQALSSQNTYTTEYFYKLLNKTKWILQNPSEILETLQWWMKQMMIKALFFNNISYSQNWGLQTPETPVIFKGYPSIEEVKICSSGRAGIEPTKTVPKTVVLPITPTPYMWPFG